jgi:uncharacterized protein YbdZ (MbtH family)
MVINPFNEVYISFVVAGKDDDGSRLWFYRFPEYNAVPLGWTITFLIFSLGYDNLKNVKVD